LSCSTCSCPASDGAPSWKPNAWPALALQRYWAGQGHCYPERLAQLVPEFLDAQPADPFDGKPLQYRKTADGFTLASSSSENNTPLFSVIKPSQSVASF
jgi:hypothetical protein